MNHNLYKFSSYSFFILLKHLFMICIFHAHNESSNLKYDFNNTTIYNVYKQVGSKIPHKLWLQRPRQLKHWLFYTTISKGGKRCPLTENLDLCQNFHFCFCLEARKTLLIEREKLSINSENAVCHDKIVHWTNGCYALGMRRRI